MSKDFEEKETKIWNRRVIGLGLVFVPVGASLVIVAVGHILGYW